MSDAAEKKHPASQRRRDKALQKGDAPKSPLLGAAIVLLAAVFLLCTFGESAFQLLVNSTQQSWQTAAVSTKSADLQTKVTQSMGNVAAVAISVASVVAVVAASVQLAQFGGKWFPQLVELKWERLSPATGFSRIFSTETLASLPFDIAKGVSLIGGVGFVVYSQAAALASVGWREPAGVLTVGLSFLWQAAAVCLNCLIAVGVAEYFWKRYCWEQRLRMTDQELREELREQNPNPQVTRVQRSRNAANRASGRSQTG